jgi:aldose 1-epimerase
MKLTAGKAELLLAPEIGGTIVGWTLDGIPLLRPTAPDAEGAREQACYPLIPFSNRVGGRSFVFEGVRHELPALLGPWAIHGAAWQLAWRMEGPTTMAVDYPGGRLWPFAFRAEQVFDLSEHALVVTMRIANLHSGRAPAAIGLHPFFPRAPDTTLRFAAASVWRAGADKIPTENTPVPPEWDFSTAHAPGDVAADNCFAGWGGRFEIGFPARRLSLQVQADPIFRHLVVYIPQHADFMAVEPVANMNDGLNHMQDGADHGFTILAPGATLEGRIVFSVATS